MKYEDGEDIEQGGALTDLECGRGGDTEYGEIVGWLMVCGGKKN